MYEYSDEFKKILDMLLKQKPYLFLFPISIEEITSMLETNSPYLGTAIMLAIQNGKLARLDLSDLKKLFGEWKSAYYSEKNSKWTTEYEKMYGNTARKL